MGSLQRKYRNGVGLAVPAGEQIEILRRSVRYFTRDGACAGEVEAAQPDRRTQIVSCVSGSRRRGAAAESALRLYAEDGSPKVTADGMVIDVVAVGGRPLQTTLNEKKQARVHDRVMELLVDVQRRLFSTVNPSKIVELLNLAKEAHRRSGSRPPMLSTASIRFSASPG